MSVHVHTVEDTLLLARLKDSDKKAFDSLYTKYWEFVFNNAYKRLTNVNLAEDVVQEVFAQLWLRRTQEAIKNLPAYGGTSNHFFGNYRFFLILLKRITFFVTLY